MGSVIGNPDDQVVKVFLGDNLTRSTKDYDRLLEEGDLSEEEKTEYLNVIEEESLRLSQMATNVLNLTKVENQTILPEIGKVDISEQLRTCVLMLERKWEKKNIEFVLPSKEYFINANEELLEQVFLNLFDNAVKFSPENMTVEASVFEGNDETTVSISNYGKEIPEEKRSKLFRKFYQADESHATEGNGVGLAVVKKIVELHKGTVSVDCRDDKVIFSVTLPRYL